MQQRSELLNAVERHITSILDPQKFDKFVDELEKEANAAPRLGERASATDA